MFEWTINQTIINNKLLRMKTISELFFNHNGGEQNKIQGS